MVTKDLCRPPMETYVDHPQRAVENYVDHPWRPAEFHWLILPTTANDISGTYFDWLMLPTTTN